MCVEHFHTPIIHSSWCFRQALECALLEEDWIQTLVCLRVCVYVCVCACENPVVCVCFAVNRVSSPQHTALPTLAINVKQMWILIMWCCQGVELQQPCHRHCISANEQRGAQTFASVEGRMRPFDNNIMKRNVSLLDSSLGKSREGRFFELL